MKRNLLLFFNIFIFSFSLFGQSKISGKVTDASSGETLVGATILVVSDDETNVIGTITDIDGNYSLEVPNDAEAIKISFTGYSTQVVKINGRSEINVDLLIGERIDEIVVVGYGIQSKAKLTQAISVVNADELKRLPVPNVSNALEGLAAGLFVAQSSGEPGFSDSSFEIRNFGNALVIIDGSPGNLNELDANEIESITVLKDAAAASVYGVQGGNGVVLIKTKKGARGKPKLTYSNQYTNTTFTAYPDFLNSVQYATVLNEGLTGSGQAPFYSEEEIEKFRSGSDPINYPNENWKDLALKKWGLQQNHNLNLEGGDKKIRYFISSGFLSQKSNYAADALKFERYNLRANVEASVTDNMTIEMKLAGRRRFIEAPGYSAENIFRELSRALPTDLAYYPDGTPAKSSFSPNHIIEGTRDANSGYYRARNNNIDAKLSLNLDVEQIPGLTLKSYGSVESSFFNNKSWGKSYTLYTLNRLTGDYDPFTASPEGIRSETVLWQNNGLSNRYVTQQSIAYENKFNEHSVKGLLLGELQSFSFEDVYARRQDFQSDLIDQLFAGSIENNLATGGERRENRLGLVGRLSYDFATKYLIEGSFRYDGSSKFAPGHQWGFFPSVSAGWKVSEEDFFPYTPNINSLKLRGSIGTAGNDGTAAYQWLSGFNYQGLFATGETATTTIDNASLPNIDLSWEVIKTYDIGLDMELLDKHLSISADYFYRNKSGVLADPSASIPSTLGVGVAVQNLHQYSNEGYEFEMRYNRDVSDDFKYNLGFIFSHSRETAVFIDEALNEDPFMRENLTQTGGYTGLRRGYISDGLFQSVEEIEGSAIQDNNNNVTIRPGDVRYVDLNEDGILDVRDQKVFGNGIKPARNYSFTFGAEYKGFSITGLFTGASGYDIYIGGEAQSPLRNGFSGYDYQTDYWTPENTDAPYPRITDGGFNDNNYKGSDYWSRNGRHLRVKNLSIGYTLPKELTARANLTNVQFYATGHNIAVFKSFNEEFDPQMQSESGWYYPHLRSFTFGLRITLQKEEDEI